MTLDPAVEALAAFRRSQQRDELGADQTAAAAAEERFANSMGEEAAAAYDALLELGARYPQAAAFQEFLIYITWSHVMENTDGATVRRGLALCEDYLARHAPADLEARRKVGELRGSFRAALGLRNDTPILDFDADTPRGGD